MLAAQAAARHENGLEANRVGHFRKALALFRNAVELRCSADGVVAADSLISKGVQGIIAGCTEIPLALKQEHLSVPYFDALTILARAAIFKAGLTPIP